MMSLISGVCMGAAVHLRRRTAAANDFLYIKCLLYERVCG